MEHNLSFSWILNNRFFEEQWLYCAVSGASSSEATAVGKADLYFIYTEVWKNRQSYIFKKQEKYTLKTTSK